MPARMLLLVAVLACAGCNPQTYNPSFPVTYGEAEQLLEQIRADPLPLERPLVCINGWRDVGATKSLTKHFTTTVDDDRFIIVQVHKAKTMEEARERVLAAVDEHFPNDDPEWTTPVDVLGFSMGGLVARFAAAGTYGDRHLRIVRLFTVATPHRGAVTATMPLPDDRLKDMRQGSDFLEGLDEELKRLDYELIAYARLGDLVVGTGRSFPPGFPLWWVSTPYFERSHVGAISDPRIMLDITRRLVGLPPVTLSPPTPLPE